MPGTNPKDNRPPVAIGQESVHVKRIAESINFLVKLGLAQSMNPRNLRLWNCGAAARLYYHSDESREGVAVPHVKRDPEFCKYVN